MPKAVITLTVASFIPNGCTTATAAITDSGGNRVYQKAGDPTIYIKSKGKSALTLQFLVVDNAGSSSVYTVTGITFSGVLQDPTGANTFTNRMPSGNGITMDDTFAAQPNWNYTIAIKRNADNATSQIDPGVENTDEN
jgi:hypothetical protein